MVLDLGTLWAWNNCIHVHVHFWRWQQGRRARSNDTRFLYFLKEPNLNKTSYIVILFIDTLFLICLGLVLISKFMNFFSKREIASSISVPFPNIKLDGKNYPIWKFKEHNNETNFFPFFLKGSNASFNAQIWGDKVVRLGMKVIFKRGRASIKGEGRKILR